MNLQREGRGRERETGREREAKGEGAEGGGGQVSQAVTDVLTSGNCFHNEVKIRNCGLPQVVWRGR